MRAVAGTRWLGVLLLVSLAGSGVVLLTRLSDPDGAVVQLLSTRLTLVAAAVVLTPALSGLLGIGLGLLTAHRGWLDQGVRALAVTGLALCLFWAALIGAFWVALHVELLPLLADENAGPGRLGVLSTLLVPAIAVQLGAALAVAVHVQAATRVISVEGFVLTARLRGLTTTGLVIRRVLRRALPAAAIVLAAELIVLCCCALIGQAVYAHMAGATQLPAMAPAMMPSESMPLVLGGALMVTTGIVVIGIATAMSRGGAVHTLFRPAPMPSTGFRSSDLLDIRDLRMWPRQPTGTRLWPAREAGVTPPVAGPGDGINLTVPRGQSLAILGEEDSGTLLLCRAVVGLLSPHSQVSSGSILFDGRELVGLAERDFRRLRGPQIAFLNAPAHDGLDPRARVGPALTALLARRPGTGRSNAHQAAVHLLTRVGIDSPEAVLGLYPAQLSPVTAQRVLLAGAVALDPQLLIAVDPGRGFDPDTETGFLDLLHDLQRERDFTLIVVSARVAAVRRCDRAAVMQDGTIVEHASAGELLAGPAHPHSRYLLGGQESDQAATGS